MLPFAIIWWLRKNYNTLKTYWSAEAETRSVTSGKTDQLLAECVVRWAGICRQPGDYCNTGIIHVHLSFPSFVSQNAQTDKSDSFEKHPFSFEFPFLFFIRTYVLFQYEFIASFFHLYEKRPASLDRSFITLPNNLVFVGFQKS